jgi:hypothetical protein
MKGKIKNVRIEDSEDAKFFVEENKWETDKGEQIHHKRTKPTL